MADIVISANAKKGVRTQHKDYAAMLDKWQRCRDCASGQDAVHVAGQKYLPKLKDQTSEDYKSYQARAVFFNAMERTITGLGGMLFRKPPQIDASENILELLDDVTMDGTPMQVFAQDVVEESLTVGRLGILVDHPTVDAQGVTVAAARGLGLRPLMQVYDTECIINWRTARINNQTVLVLVVLKESASTLTDEFTEKTEDRYRVLDLIPTNGAYSYRVRVFRINDKDEDELVSEMFPLMNGRTLDSIPFYFINVDDLTPEMDDPPLLDLAVMNLAHYRVTADYEHGCHFTGLPTPVVSGYVKETEGEKFYIGSMSAWVFPDPNAKAAFLEFHGDGLKTLADNLQKKEQQMAILGARMLEVRVRGVESADVAAIHRASENSMLSSVAQSISLGITKALKTFSAWAGVDADVKFDLNRDFFPMPMDPATLTALIAGWQSGAYSYETLFENLKEGEIIALERTVDEEQSKIQNAPPQLLGALPLMPGDRGNVPNVASAGAEPGI